MTTKECLNALELALKSNVTNLIPCDMDLKLLREVFPWLEPCLEIVDKNIEKDKHTFKMSEEEFWTSIKSSDGSKGLIKVVSTFVSGCVTSILNADEDIDPHKNFQVNIFNV
jgi:hypothetical protein